MMEPSATLIADHYCPPSVHATESYPVNLQAPIGVPFGMGAEEQATLNGVVSVPGNAAGEVSLTWRIPPEYDFYVDRVMVALWTVTTEQSIDYLTFVQPDDISVASEVKLRLFDPNLRMNLSQQDMLWGLIYGDGRTPFPLLMPWVMNGGRVYQGFVRNLTSTDFAISVTLWGRYRRVQSIPGTWSATDKILYDKAMEQIARTGCLSRGVLSADQEASFVNAGLNTVIPLTQDGVPLLVAAGSLTTPTQATQSINTGSRGVFMAHQMMGRQYVESGSQFTNGNTQPVFVRIRDDRRNMWLNNVPIPMCHLVGDGRQPHILPVEWSWGRNAQIDCQLWNMSASNLRLNIETEGWLRACNVGC